LNNFKDWWSDFEWKPFFKHIKRAVLIILHCVIFGVIGFFASQYLYLEHKAEQPYEDSLMRASEVVKEKGCSMNIRIERGKSNP